MPGYPGVTVVTNSCVCLFSHTRLRVHWPPGIPCALFSFGRALPAQLGHIAPRDRGGLSGFFVIARSDLSAVAQRGKAEATKQSIVTVGSGCGLLRFARNDAPHSQPSSPAKAGDPVIRDVSDRTEKPRRTDRPVEPDDDSSLWRTEATWQSITVVPANAGTHNHRC